MKKIESNLCMFFVLGFGLCIYVKAFIDLRTSNFSFRFCLRIYVFPAYKVNDIMIWKKKTSRLNSTAIKAILELYVSSLKWLERKPQYIFDKVALKPVC